ncbi:MAG: endonuclease [Syntrophothermus sp.]
MKKNFYALFSLILFVFSAAGQIPAGYYDAAAGKTGTALQSALHNIIKGHTSVSYSSLPTYFQSTDKKPDQTVWDMYSDIPGSTPPYSFQFNQDECGNYNSEGDCFNREHSWPKSWFGGEVMPMYSDLFHLYPTDGYVNNRRDNYPYGEVGNASWTSMNGSKLGSCTTAGYSGTVFEPIDAYKGDFARSYFYMSTRYYTEDSGWPGSAETTGSQLKPWALAMMLQWSSEDPVSAKEVARNNAVYGIQHNRNPFIDHPEYAGAIWGFPTGIGMENIVLVNAYPNPATEYFDLNISCDRLNSEKLLMMDALGVTVQVDIQCNGNTCRANVSSLKKGLWIFAVTTGEKVLHGKVIINR